MAPRGEEPARDGKARSKRRRRKFFLAAAALTELAAVRQRGYGFGGNVVVRCRDGHVFSTIWIPGASVKAARLGFWRFQRCPVGNHWTLVTPIQQSELTDDEQRAAAENKDVRLP